MTVESAYRSDHATVLDTWYHHRAAMDHRGDYVDTLRETTGRDVVGSVGIFGATLHGLAHDPAIDGRLGVPAGRTREDLPGWRLDAKEGHWVPALRTPEGKAHAADLREHRVPKPTWPGMPTEVLVGDLGPPLYREGQTRILTPGCEVQGGVAWITWGTSHENIVNAVEDRPGRRGHALIDPAIWTHVPLSEYHAMLEARKGAGVLA